MTGISKGLEGTPSARTYHRIVEVVSEGLVTFKTDTGFFGTALPNIREKDEVALIAGLRMPFILRTGATKNGGYRILGISICAGYDVWSVLVRCTHVRELHSDSCLVLKCICSLIITSVSRFLRFYSTAVSNIRE
jgi:hypothetical protein